MTPGKRIKGISFQLLVFLGVMAAVAALLFSAADGQTTTSLPGSSGSTGQLKADGLPPGLYPQVLAAIQKDASPDYNVYLAEDQADNRHWLVRSFAETDRYLAANATHGFNTIFTGGGIQVTPLSQEQTNEAASWQWGLTLTGYGNENDVAPLPVPQLAVEGNRVEYRYGAGATAPALTEWYVNGPMGLEQGFTLSSRPPGHKEGSLRLDFSVAGDLSSQLTSDGDTILFLDGHGVSKLSYGSLYTYDTTGRELPSKLALRDGGVAILVDDANAVYPVTVDPFIQQAKLTAQDGAAGAQFGFSVAVSGDTALIGALHDDAPNNDQGSAYVFVRSGGSWSQQAKLTASDGAGGEVEGDEFGFSVAISGDTAVIGAVGDDLGANRVDSGSAYVFVKPAEGWSGNLTETAKLTVSGVLDGASGDHFGISVAISGDTVVIGARDNAGQNQARPRQGSAYVFVKPAGGWSGSLSQITKLSPLFGQSFDSFGVSVAIDRDTIVVGAPNDDVGVFARGTDQGSAYVFVKPAGGWPGGLLKSTATLTAQDGAASDNFGKTVAIAGDTVVAGALNDDFGCCSKPDQGSAYVFVKPAGGWSTTSAFTAKLTAQDGEASDQFGSSVAIAGDTVVIAAHSDDDKGTDSGSAYAFVKPAGGWSTTSDFTDKLTAQDGEAGDQFGGDPFLASSVAIAGDTVVVGAYLDDDNGSASGSVYVFQAAPSTIFVDDDTCPGAGSGTSGDPFCTIQAAVDDAIPGNTILVSPGTYSENIDVRTDNVTIRSTGGPSVTTVGQNDPEDHVFDVEADGVTIEGFGVVYSGQIQHVHGIVVGRDSAGSIIKGNAVSSTFVNLPPLPTEIPIFGICVCGGIDPGPPAVLVFGPSNTTVQDNTLSHNPFAILVFAASNTLVKGNSISDSARINIGVFGGASGTIVEDNAVSSSSFVGIIVSSFLGIAPIDTIVRNNVVSGSGIGGIGVFRGASTTTVQHNVVSGSGEFGIGVASGASNNTIQDNTVNGNRCGVFLGFGASNNQFIDNDLRFNVLGAVSAETATVAFFQNPQPQTDGLVNTFNGNLPDSLTPCTTAQGVENLIDDLQLIVDGNSGTPLGDKLEDAIAKLQNAVAELDKTPPDNQAALGGIEGAVGELEAAVSSGLLDPEQGGQLMDQLAEIARIMAQNALNEAIAEGGDPVVINDAQQALAEGDALRVAGAYKDAVNKYKDALAKAESTP